MIVSLPVIGRDFCKHISPNSAWRSCCVTKLGKFSENKQIFKSERHVLLFHERLQFSNKIRYGSCTDCQQKSLEACRFFSCNFCVTYMPAPRFFRRGPVCVCLIIKFLRHLTSHFLGSDKFEIIYELL